jgi:transcriptional regulator with XRE-family HTH domain
MLRAERGLSQEKAAEMIGVGQLTLSELERGKRSPYGTTISKLAKGYGVPVEELLDDVAELPAGKGEAPQAGPSQEFSKALRAPRDTVPLGDVASDERLEATTRELSRLYAQLEAGEITMPTYRAQRNAAFAALFAAIDRSSTEAG